ncbi:hypothetical protein P43SY_002184 [Pythium insidiosum]|uniref:G-protein coupled receptors family 3 profile domain-containing protein n=1 Tax=Pythium insidiosum TaxID=114742 RepID=A0AAD5Q686_PYTIN|nr:hypothetical protein P43SY_002184 [Pythium insidiosum]
MRSGRYGKRKQPVLFYHYEPDLFHFQNPGLFSRVFLPRSVPERVALATGLFGENGYGKATNNPVDVDFPTTQLTKYAASLLQNHFPIGSLVGKFALKDIHVNDLLRRYLTASKDASVVDPTFQAACGWLRNNYAVWSAWLDRMPICDINTHVHFHVSGCEPGDDVVEHKIHFEWNSPHPENDSLPHNCDGGLSELPPPLRTSRSCKWILEDPSKWKPWILKKPTCDESFYKYNITACDSDAKRTVKYWWLLADPLDASTSIECEGGVTLPADVKIDCEYMPHSSPVFFIVAVIAGIVVAALVLAIVFVLYYRNMPIIKRSQYEFLVLVIIGGIMMCLAAVFYAGEPTDLLCGARPFFTCFGFTTIFGSLFVKSLRVYRVFMRTAFKKATVSSALMIKIFLLLVVVDVLIIGAWFVADFPKPTITIKEAKEFRGQVDVKTCNSASFIFTALLMFWKAIVLFMGLYASFLIRNVSSDFQESIWMFASSMMVLIGCLVVLPLAYLVEMAAAVFYVFLAGCILLCTALVMMFMLLPKMTRLHAVASSSSSTSNPSTATSTAISVKGADSKRDSVSPTGLRFKSSGSSRYVANSSASMSTTHTQHREMSVSTEQHHDTDMKSTNED